MPKDRRWLKAAIVAATTESLPPLPWERRAARGTPGTATPHAAASARPAPVHAAPSRAAR